MRILLLGHQGLLGQALAKVLKGFDLTSWDIEEIDITNFAETKAKINALKPEIIVNATGYTAVDQAEKEPEKANLVNGQAVGHLAELCHSLNALLIHFSTDYVFDGQKKEGYNEDDPKNPVNAYGKSKALGEDLIQKNLEKFFIIRLSWLFGPGGKNFIQTMLKLAQEKPELKVVDDQFGKPTYSVDLANGVKSVIEEFQANRLTPGIYHLTNEEICNWYQFAQAAFKLKDVSIPFIPVSSAEFPTPAKRPPYSILNNHKLPPLRPWVKALQDYLS